MNVKGKGKLTRTNGKEVYNMENKNSLVNETRQTISRTPFKNRKLEAATLKIERARATAEKSFFTIAQTMKQVYDDSGILIECGFKNIEDYSEKVFGYKKANTRKMIAIANRFMDRNGIKELYNGFSYSNLAELLPINDEEIKSGITAGEISADSTQKEIREYVKNTKNPQTTEGDTENAVKTETSKKSCPIDNTEENDGEISRSTYKYITVKVNAEPFTEAAEIGEAFDLRQFIIDLTTAHNDSYECVSGMVPMGDVTKVFVQGKTNLYCIALG